MNRFARWPSVVHRGRLPFGPVRALMLGKSAANDNRHKPERGHWSISDERCICAAYGSMAPCWVCTESAECGSCGFFELEQDGQWEEDEFRCDICIEEDEKHWNDRRCKS